MISMLPLLPEESLKRFYGSARMLRTSAERWQRVHDSRLIGHWEAFPFHSAKDGLSTYVGNHAWLSECVTASIEAALRLQPEMLVVMSKRGANLIKKTVLEGISWRTADIGTPKTTISYFKDSRLSNVMEVVAIPRQWFSCCAGRRVLDFNGSAGVAGGSTGRCGRANRWSPIAGIVGKL